LDKVLCFCQGPSLELCPPTCSWDYKCVPPHLAFLLSVLHDIPSHVSMFVSWKFFRV
jgi:hypothetical protein